MPFECRIPVRFGDIDIAKIVYYPRFLHYCHVAMEECFGAVVGQPYHEAVMGDRVGYPTVKAEAEYLAPVGFGEVIRMQVIAEHVGTSSVRWRYEGRRASDGVLAFRVLNTCVAVDMDAWKSIPIPARHRAAFETLLDAAPTPAPKRRSATSRPSAKGRKRR
jgi:4-hydroxybenzoyl-CoA thioesterase